MPGDGAVVRLSPAGEVEWLQPLRADFTIATLAADADGTVAVAGTYRQSIDLSAGPLSSHGDLDLFVASFSAQGSDAASYVNEAVSSNGGEIRGALGQQSVLATLNRQGIEDVAARADVQAADAEFDDSPPS